MSKLPSDLSTVTRVGHDLVKHIFQVHAVDATGAEIDKRSIRRAKLLDYFASLPPVTIVIRCAVPRIIRRASSRRWATRSC